MEKGDDDDGNDNLFVHLYCEKYDIVVMLCSRHTGKWGNLCKDYFVVAQRLAAWPSGLCLRGRLSVSITVAPVIKGQATDKGEVWFYDQVYSEAIFTTNVRTTSTDSC